MAAGLGFKDFTTGEVLTAADVDGYLMQGIWVFASAAARDAAVTSPQEGNFAFLKDTNTTTYYTGSAWANLDTTGMVNPMTTTGDTIYSSSGSTPARLGIGSTGQVLTVAGGVPSWATPASGGGMTLLSTTTLSGAQTISITSISQSYKSLFGIIYGVTNATANGILRINPNGTAQTVSSSYDGVGGSTTVQWQISGVNYVSDMTDANNSYSFKIDNYTSGSNYKPVLWSGGYTDASAIKRGLVGGGQIYTNTAISSLDINHSQGNFSTGTVLLYGVS